MNMIILPIKKIYSGLAHIDANFPNNTSNSVIRIINKTEEKVRVSVFKKPFEFTGKNSEKINAYC
ncbi:MAG: hypothetical protein AB1782_20330 [Cyanobacteriota bacterium]